MPLQQAAPRRNFYTDPFTALLDAKLPDSEMLTTLNHTVAPTGSNSGGIVHDKTLGSKSATTRESASGDGIRNDVSEWHDVKTANRFNHNRITPISNIIVIALSQNTIEPT